MNGFEHLVKNLRHRLADVADLELEVSAPARTNGVWFVTLQAKDGYSVEATWSRHRGFSVDAGYNFGLFDAPHESYGIWEDTADRMISLWKAREATNPDLPVPIADLRKQRGQLQMEVAAQMGITKGGLAQIEASANEGKVQVDTLGKLVAAMGGRLVISAAFPDGTERKVAVGR